MDKAHKDDVLLIMGDFNAKVGEGAEGRTVGKFGLGIRNESGDKLINLSKTNNMVITNTQFKQHKRRLYTWTSADGRYRNQIDYILIQGRWASTVELAKTLPGADCGSDH